MFSAYSRNTVRKHLLMKSFQFSPVQSCFVKFSLSVMSPVWVNCNVCRRTGCRLQAKLNITNCGFIFCSNCKAAAARRVCRACQGRCKRTVPLDSKAPREVRSLFESIATKIKK